MNTVTVPSGSTDDGIYSPRTLEIGGYGDLTVNAPNEISDGLKAGDDFLFDKFYGNVTINAGDNGIYADDDVKFEYSSVDINITSAESSGICAENFSKSSDAGKLTVDAKNYGIFTNSNCYLEYCPGDISIASGEDGIYGSNSIYVYHYYGDITIDAGGSGIYSDDYIYFSSETTCGIDITADECGIEVGSGCIEYHNCGPLAIDAGTKGVYVGNGYIVFKPSGETVITAADNGIEARFSGGGTPDNTCIEPYNSDLTINAVNNGILFNTTDPTKYLFVYPYGGDITVDAGGEMTVDAGGEMTVNSDRFCIDCGTGSLIFADGTCPMNKFDDLNVNAWYHDGIHYCIDNGIMEGMPGNKFEPNGNITREQLAAILYRYAQYKGEGFTGSWMFLLDYVDREDISSWADEAVHWCTMKGVVNGKEGNTFDPQGDATRAEAAAMIQRFCESLEK